MLTISRTKRSLSNRERGAVMVETAMTIGIYMFILFVGIELVISMFHVLAATHAAMKGARFATTINPSNPTTDGVASLKTTVQSVARQYGLEIPDNDIRVCPVPLCEVVNNVRVCPVTVCDPVTDSLGTPGQFVSLRVTIPVGSGMLGLTWNHQLHTTYLNEGPFYSW